MLNSSDPNLVTQATGTIYSLAKKEAPKHALVSNQELCPAMAQVLLDSNCETSSDTKKKIIATLATLSEDEKGRRNCVL